MQATKVKIRDELLETKPLSNKHKRQLREQAIIALINSKPYGERIKISEVALEAHLSGDGAAGSFLNGMIRRGKIVRHEIGPSRLRDGFFYVVASGIKTRQPRPVMYNLDDLTNKAMQYAWNTTLEKPNELKGFIEYLGNMG
jgi:hypothetical protein